MPGFTRTLFSSRPQAPSAPPQRPARPVSRTRQPREIRPESITVAILCFLPEEVDAVRYSLDEEFVCRSQAASTGFVFVYGRIGNHSVIIAQNTDTGPTKAARIAATVSFYFRNVRNAVIVGTGGGIPGPADVRLGDIVVSIPKNGHPGVIQYDFGKYEEGGFVHVHTLDSPSRALLSADRLIQVDELEGVLGEIIAMSGFERPTTLDVLFDASFDHIKRGRDCSECLRKGQTKTVPRSPRPDQQPVIHRGLILSGSGVVKNPRDRDVIRRGHANALCFETEAAGIINEIPCIVVRGISNYADTHMRNEWRGYAAALSAAYCKILLRRLQS